jgi:hypothetical protein
MEKHLTYWWFSQLKTENSGVAWYGKNDISEGVGVSWCALNNPFPNKKIKSISFAAPEGNGIYTLFAITLSNQEHYIPVKPTSYGGPDNWAASTAMSAMIEGLAGIKNAKSSEAYSSAIISPKWITTKADKVFVTARFAASKAYVSYKYFNDTGKKQINLLLTGSGKNIKLHLLLPDAASEAITISKDGKAISFQNMMTPEGAKYVDSDIVLTGTSSIVIQYK